MDLALGFRNGRIHGTGMDGIGEFIITGTYSSATLECSWRKEYIGMHTVVYEGYAEKVGIWGLWKLAIESGGFHIWPVQEGAGLAAAMEDEEPVEDAVAGPVLVQ
jgi:hypothetical protein